uniref:Uncharacterized protein n=1 Tax=Cacopsylla melanoneura TaxID=428564 RepID=A0A8D8R5V3_9HEMI
MDQVEDDREELSSRAESPVEDNDDAMDDNEDEDANNEDEEPSVTEDIDETDIEAGNNEYAIETDTESIKSVRSVQKKSTAITNIFKSTLAKNKPSIKIKLNLKQDKVEKDPPVVPVEPMSLRQNVTKSGKKCCYGCKDKKIPAKEEPKSKTLSKLKIFNRSKYQNIVESATKPVQQHPFIKRLKLRNVPPSVPSNECNKIKPIKLILKRPLDDKLLRRNSHQSDLESDIENITETPPEPSSKHLKTSKHSENNVLRDLSPIKETCLDPPNTEEKRSITPPSSPQSLEPFDPEKEFECSDDDSSSDNDTPTLHTCAHCNIYGTHSKTDLISHYRTCNSLCLSVICDTMSTEVDKTNSAKVDETNKCVYCKIFTSKSKTMMRNHVKGCRFKPVTQRGRPRKVKPGKELDTCKFCDFNHPDVNVFMLHLRECNAAKVQKPSNTPEPPTFTTTNTGQAELHKCSSCNYVNTNLNIFLNHLKLCNKNYNNLSLKDMLLKYKSKPNIIGYSKPSTSTEVKPCDNTNIPSSSKVDVFNVVNTVSTNLVNENIVQKPRIPSVFDPIEEEEDNSIVSSAFIPSSISYRQELQPITSSNTEPTKILFEEDNYTDPTDPCSKILPLELSESSESEAHSYNKYQTHQCESQAISVETGPEENASILQDTINFEQPPVKTADSSEFLTENSIVNDTNLEKPRDTIPEKRVFDNNTCPLNGSFDPSRFENSVVIEDNVPTINAMESTSDNSKGNDANLEEQIQETPPEEQVFEYNYCPVNDSFDPSRYENSVAVEDQIPENTSVQALETVMKNNVTEDVFMAEESIIPETDDSTIPSENLAENPDLAKSTEKDDTLKKIEETAELTKEPIPVVSSEPITNEPPSEEMKPRTQDECPVEHPEESLTPQTETAPKRIPSELPTEVIITSGKEVPEEPEGDMGPRRLSFEHFENIASSFYADQSQSDEDIEEDLIRIEPDETSSEILLSDASVPNDDQIAIITHENVKPEPIGVIETTYHRDKTDNQEPHVESESNKVVENDLAFDVSEESNDAKDTLSLDVSSIDDSLSEEKISTISNRCESNETLNQIDSIQDECVEPAIVVIESAPDPGVNAATNIDDIETDHGIDAANSMDDVESIAHDDDYDMDEEDHGLDSQRTCLNCKSFESDDVNELISHIKACSNVNSDDDSESSDSESSNDGDSDASNNTVISIPQTVHEVEEELCQTNEDMCTNNNNGKEREETVENTTLDVTNEPSICRKRKVSREEETVLEGETLFKVPKLKIRLKPLKPFQESESDNVSELSTTITPEKDHDEMDHSESNTCENIEVSSESRKKKTHVEYVIENVESPKVSSEKIPELEENAKSPASAEEQNEVSEKHDEEMSDTADPSDAVSRVDDVDHQALKCDNQSQDNDQTAQDSGDSELFCSHCNHFSTFEVDELLNHFKQCTAVINEHGATPYISTEFNELAGKYDSNKSREIINAKYTNIFLNKEHHNMNSPAQSSPTPDGPLTPRFPRDPTTFVAESPRYMTELTSLVVPTEYVAEEDDTNDLKES